MTRPKGGWHATKRTLLRPLTALRRRRAGPLNPYTRAIYEAHDYRPSILRFFEATRSDPEILVDVQLGEGAVLLDVGAYTGEWSTRMLGRADREDQAHILIHAFEPEDSAVEDLRAALGNDPRIVINHFGLGGSDRTEHLAIGGPGSSIFQDGEAPGFLGSRLIEIRDVDAVLSALGHDHLDVVKINIEGGEFEVIDRLHETGWLGRIGTVIVQFHEFAPGAHRRRRRNRRQLAETHRCTWSYPWVYERWDRR